MKVTSQHLGGTLPASPDSASALNKANKSNLDQLSSLGKNPNTPKAERTNSTEKVNLSQRVLDMQKIKELATPNDSIDEVKVARLQKMIDEGSYKVDADTVADRLVDDHLNIPS